MRRPSRLHSHVTHLPRTLPLSTARRYTPWNAHVPVHGMHTCQPMKCTCGSSWNGSSSSWNGTRRRLRPAAPLT
eukprot:3671450-Rhodomonas_salina.3